ncbi:MAG TPA: Hsp33 family molecular chaperone HslO [Syntrophomonas sp.]|nr:Hsp33 family molecular chaperone HslO [Syntrophomonas sp.]HRW11972.1 Hsp33 family molecular chaperone HslO [Syntrophomonas sp.]
MQNQDYLIKLIDAGQNVRVWLARTNRLVEEAHIRHQTSATATAALGRVLTAAVMMGSDLKSDQDLISLRFNGNGPAGTIIATADGNGHVKGLIGNPQADLPSRSPGKLAVGDLVGAEGYLEVRKDLGLKQPFEGKVPLVSGEIAEDLAQYFMQSEQIPALVSLGVLVGADLRVLAAGGLIVQALPNAEDAVLEILENNILSLGQISQLVLENETLEDIAASIMQGIEYTIIARMNLAFACNCSRERLAIILAGLNEEEIREAAENNKDIEAVCNFCRTTYTFSPDEIKALKSEKP